MRLANKVAIITGAGSGIGRSIAQVFAAQGVKVVAAGRTLNTLQETTDSITAKGHSASLVQMDVGDWAAVKALVQQTLNRHGQLDIVVHNAAMFSRDPLESMSEETLEAMLNINLKACFSLTKYAIPPMKVQGKGRILITSSVTGPQVAMPNIAHYGASKGGVNGFIRMAALELAPHNITVNGVEPGYIQTPALEGMIARFGQENIERFIPMKRLGKPEDVAQAMLFLASDEASYITGQTIVVDGGSTLPESPLFYL